jgi:hypothetical protein
MGRWGQLPGSCKGNSPKRDPLTLRTAVPVTVYVPLLGFTQGYTAGAPLRRTTFFSCAAPVFTRVGLGLVWELVWRECSQTGRPGSRPLLLEPATAAVSDSRDEKWQGMSADCQGFGGLCTQVRERGNSFRFPERDVSRTVIIWASDATDPLNGVQEVAGSNPVAPTWQASL